MLTQTQLEKYLWGAATALRGTIDAGDYKQYIFPLLFFKRISDVYDEEYQSALAESDNDEAYAAFAENHHFIVPQGSHWNDVREVTTNIGMALQDAMRAIEQANPDTLYGIFGDASWTNKERLSDEMLTNLIEHFSQHTLSIANVPDDKLGDAYEYLIKEFADDSGHTAAEFYTNRTVVKLMTLIMNPQPGESVYDPTCGSGGLLLNCALHLKDEGKEYRTLKLYGQEINLLTSAIARMNMFMHGIEEFDIIRGDTLANPGLLENDTLKTFNVILANPPYSIKSWDRKTFENDPYGRNIWGTPPQGCADYAFQQHIQKSLDPDNGRSISLWPHGILFRDAEASMRKQMIEQDLVECVIGLGPNLFYNSPMEACLLITRTNKSEKTKGKVLFINAVHEVKQEKNMGYLQQQHTDKIFSAYQAFENQQDFAVVVNKEEILEKNGNMAINLYIRPDALMQDQQSNLPDAYQQWQASSLQLKQSMSSLFTELAQSTQASSHKTAKKWGGVLLEPSKSEKQQAFDIENFSIDKSDWEPVKLGDVVFEPKESSKDPVADGIKHVVGLEHIDSEDIHLRRSATLEEASTTFTKKFAKGDVLFGRRRAYLKKAAKADFDGICSGDITVMRAKQGLLPELLPFLINNDKFFDYAVKHSAGGLSPRVKFKDLAEFEFLLPPKEQQLKLAELFWAADDEIKSHTNLHKKLSILYNSLTYKVFFRLLDKMKHGDINNNNLSDLISISIGNGVFKTKDSFGTGTLLINVTDIYESFRVDPLKLDRVEVNDKEKQSFSARSGDIIFNRSSLVKEGIGHACLVPENAEKLVFECHLMRIRPNQDKVDSRYLCRYSLSPFGRNYLISRSQTTTMTTINQYALNKMPIPVPSLAEQEEIADLFDSLEKTSSLLDLRINSSRNIQKQLINQVF